MSKEVLEQVVLKASSDARFRSQLNDNFDSAIRPYELTEEEKSQLRSGMVGGADEREVRRTLAASHVSSNVAAATNVASNTEAASHTEAASNTEVASNTEASSHLTME